jgi:hypothetical protein
MTVNNSQTIKELDPIQKKEDTQLRLAIKSYKDHQYIDIREYWKPPDNDQYLPTKKGITIPVDDTFDMLEDLTAGLEELYQFLVRQEGKAEAKTDGNRNEG